MYITAARTDEVREGEILALMLDDLPIALTRKEGVIHAFGNVCTHDDGPLADGEINECCVVCPRHGAQFDLRTGKATFPAVMAIPIYPVLIEDGEVKVKIED